MSSALFRAPLPTASNYAGAGSCVLCAAQVLHSFRVERLDVMVTCPTCSSARGFQIDFSTAEACSGCGASLSCPVRAGDACVCLGCIEAGRATFRHDTDAGAVDWTELDSPVSQENRLPPGRTPSEDKLDSNPPQPRERSSFALTGPNAGWVARSLEGEPIAKTAPNTEEVERLRRTPLPSTWQQLCWPVCCNAFLVYYGEWSRADFVAAARGDEEAGRTLFLGAVDKYHAGRWDIDWLSEGGALMFCCRLCERRLVIFDFS